MWCLFGWSAFIPSVQGEGFVNEGSDVNLLAGDGKLCFNDGNPAAFLRLTLESLFSGVTFPMGARKHVSGDI